MKTFFRFAVLVTCILFLKNSYSQSWSLTGNAGTTTSSNFLGTTDNKHLIFRTKNIERMRINNAGFIGIGTKTPATTLHVVGEETLQGDLTLQSGTGEGDINFTYYQQSIRFPNPSTDSRENSSMIYMVQSPSTASRMVLAHSENFKNWGLQYNDAKDQFDFLGAGNSRMAINLANGYVGIGNEAPAYRLDVSGTSRFMGNIGVQTVPNTRTIQCGSTQGALIGIGTQEYIQDIGSYTLGFGAHLVPEGDGYYSLGSSSLRWNTVWAMDVVETSDARDKSNIRDLNYGLKEILQLRPVKFNWKNNPANDDKLGVIAQEIKKVLPEVVRDWEYKIDEQTGKKTKVPTQKLGVMYADIIPVLIRGMQEQQKQIEELKQLVNQLTNAQVSSSSTSNVTISNATLEQNTPNPATNTTAIRYNVAGNNAQLNITDGNGKMLKQIQLSSKGTGTVNIDCTTLVAGTYYYSLFVDGKTIDSKKMIVLK